MEENGIGYNYVVLRPDLIKKIVGNDKWNSTKRSQKTTMFIGLIFPIYFHQRKIFKFSEGGKFVYGPPAIGGSINLIANPF